MGKATRDTYRLEISLPGLPPLQRAGSGGGHWRKRWAEGREWKRRVLWATVGEVPEAPLERARVTCTRHSAQEPDRDNAHAAWKPLLDALVTARILTDDDPEHLELVVRWELAPRGQGRVTLVVEDIGRGEVQV